MNSKEVTLVKNALEQKKFNVVNEYAKIIHSDKGELVVNEYAGKDVRIYKGKDNTVNVLYPKNCSVVQEGHVAQAIANGTIFDDADEVDRNAMAIERTSLPYNAMINGGKNIPSNVKPMIAIVIGKIGDDGSFDPVAERINGENFLKDAVATKDEDNGNNINDVINNYLDYDKEAPYTTDMGHMAHGLDKELDDIHDTDFEDAISDEDVVDSYDDFDIEALEKDADDKKEEDEDDDNDNDDDDNDSDDDDSEDDDDKINEYYEEPLFEENNVVQEGVIKTLKRIGYDPKTKTLITDIPNPKDKNEKKVRCKVVFDPTGTGAYIDIPDDDDVDKVPVIHLPVSELLFGNTKDVISTLKHEEGHLYVSMNPTNFEKDFARAKKLVDRFSSKLSDHGNVPEEYVADLYSARHSDDKGESFINGLKKSGIRNRKSCKDLKKTMEMYINGAIKALKAIDKIKNHIETDSKGNKIEYKKNVDEAKSNLTKVLTDVDQFVNTVTTALDITGPGPGSYARSFEAPSVMKNKSGGSMYKRAISLKETIYKIIDANKKMLTTKISPRLQYVDEICTTLKKSIPKIHEAIDKFVDSVDFEIKARISFIRKWINEYTDSELEDKLLYLESVADELSEANDDSTVVVPTDTVEECGDNNCGIEQEGFLTKKPKKLKPIGRDVVAYITCEMNDIRSANDQAMLAGYTCSKIELVDFYLTVLDTQDARYIVPHNKTYLLTMKADLERLLAQILKIRPINRSEQIWRVNYPTT